MNEEGIEKTSQKKSTQTDDLPTTMSNVPPPVTVENKDFPFATSNEPPTVSTKKKDNYVYDCKCCDIIGYLTVIVTLLLNLIFGIVFIVLTAIGKENVHSREKNCDCTQYTPSMGNGLGASLLLELAMMVLWFVLYAIAELTKNKSLEKSLVASSIFVFCLLALNYLGFLSTTIAAIVFVGTGGSCCSATSVIVASISVAITAFKLMIISVCCCWLCAQDDMSCDTDTRRKRFLITVQPLN